MMKAILCHSVRKWWVLANLVFKVNTATKSNEIRNTILK